jgi:hypothetical protein
VNPSLLRGLPFDYATAFTPISLVVTFPSAVAVKNDFPARTLAACGRRCPCARCGPQRTHCLGPQWVVAALRGCSTAPPRSSWTRSQTARWAAKQKLKNLVEGVRSVRERMGLTHG